MRPTLCVFSLSAALVAVTQMAVLNSSPALAETPEWFTCPDSSEFKLRRDAEADALNAREHQPSAGAVTSRDLATHARLSAMSYAMYEAYTAGGDPLDALDKRLRPVALIHGDPGREPRLRRRKARDTRTFYGVVADDRLTGRRLIILRGTLQPNEWIRNVQARLRPFLRSQVRRPFPGRVGQRILQRARVHNGFMNIYSSFEMTRVSDNARMSFAEGLEDLVVARDATFIGHSLGGALATLAGVDAALMSPSDGKRLRIVTLASPRVGNEGFARLAQAVGRIDRVCNVVDLVPAAPPSTRLTPYVHVGNVFRDVVVRLARTGELSQQRRRTVDLLAQHLCLRVHDGSQQIDRRPRQELPCIAVAAMPLHPCSCGASKKGRHGRRRSSPAGLLIGWAVQQYLIAMTRSQNARRLSTPLSTCPRGRPMRLADELVGAAAPLDAPGFELVAVHFTNHRQLFTHLELTPLEPWRTGIDEYGTSPVIEHEGIAEHVGRTARYSCTRLAGNVGNFAGLAWFGRFDWRTRQTEEGGCHEHWDGSVHSALH